MVAASPLRLALPSRNRHGDWPGVQGPSCTPPILGNGLGTSVLWRFRIHGSGGVGKSVGKVRGGAEEPPTASVPQPVSDSSSGLTVPDSADLESAGLITEGGSSGLVLGASPKMPQVPTVLPAELPDVPTMAPIKLPNISSPPPTKPVAGVNGTQCSAYPACVAAGIKEGACCPTKANVPLGCCSGIMPPPAVKEEGGANPFAKATSACSLYPKCMHLGLTGSCCPAPNGAKLGCCDD
ncbi:hypothetical protein AK812_SmicGene14364 [Symbiodinium microadriaticum]|uniref:Uncharacterized protein n=1 Tax=Symbiodinium microadriaticum TaxID=2951 RepID=A0A1Q9E5Q8_SYMMI|nr:hypothetical protein AK812_SmicGene14364 [Symbiodinium microadriaticum]